MNLGGEGEENQGDGGNFAPPISLKTTPLPLQDSRWNKRPHTQGEGSGVGVVPNGYALRPATSSANAR